MGTDLTKPHLLTFDIEDWYQVYFANEVFPQSMWPHHEDRIKEFCDKILEILDRNHVKATFFSVGFLVKQHPEIFRNIRKEGHEIASHGYWHKTLEDLSPEECKFELLESKKVIEDVLGEKIYGFRAPGYSISQKRQDIIDLIKEAGYLYDSSLLWCDSKPFEIRQGLMELAPNSIRIGKSYIPSNGGFFFRILPYFVFSSYVKFLNQQAVQLNYYTHSWEMTDNYPRLKLPLIKKFIQYYNLKSVPVKFERLVRDYPFTSIEKAHSHLWKDLQ